MEFQKDINVTFQSVIRSNGVIEFKYPAMASPPGGSANSGTSRGIATKGLNKAGTAVVPSASRIINQSPDFRITDPAAFLNETALAALKAQPYRCLQLI